MVQLHFSSNDLEEGRIIVQEGKVLNLLFSNNAYQIELRASNESTIWVFIQLGDQHEVSDYFVSSETLSDKERQRYLAASYLCIMGYSDEPLDERFVRSIWNRIFLILARRHGFSSKVFKEKSDDLLIQNRDQTLFSLSATSTQSKEKVRELIFEKEVETEENSLKFLSLSSEEIQKWKDGHPSFKLQYELSFWSDLAKWLMFLASSQKPYQLNFNRERDKLPHEINIQFDDIDIKVPLMSCNWPEIVECLKDEKTDLKVHSFPDFQLKEISFDPQSGTMRLMRESIRLPEDKVSIGDWFFVDGVFYPKSCDELFYHDFIKADEVARLFKHYLPIAKRYIKFPISSERRKLNYHLYFDQSHDLHIQSYLFEKGDIKPHLVFREWVYIDNKGFFGVSTPTFPMKKQVIPKDSIPAFISMHKVWLNQIPAFQIHLTQISTKLQYHVDLLKKTLLFTSDITTKDEGTIEFSDWVYLRGQGFFPKSSARAPSSLPTHIYIQKNDVSRFIRKYEPELELIRGFFSDRCPIKNMLLNIQVSDERHIHIHPVIHYHEGYSESNVHLFGKYSYVESEGFYKLSSDTLLPEGYDQPKVVQGFDEKVFLEEDLVQLQDEIDYLDPLLQRPSRLKLVLEDANFQDKAGHFLCHMAYVSEIGRVDACVIKEAVDRNATYVMTSAGLIFLSSSRFNWLKTSPERCFLLNTQRIRLTPLEWVKLNAFDQVEVDKKVPKKIKNHLARLKTASLDDLEHDPPLDGLKSQLRPYQKIGVRWLWSLYLNHLSGLLADEMGLGKTHQAMGLIAAVHNYNHIAQKKFLVVCPTSVLYHWQSLLENFLPFVSPRLYYGQSRTLVGFEDENDILITTFGTLRSDIDLLQSIPFEVVILDELQTAKNRFSQTHKALLKVKAKMKLGLTGTPIENYLIELKALFDIVLPGLFPDDEIYRELFINPIERMGSDDKKGLLKKLIEPFILRRRKQQVLKDLPDKIEEVMYVELSEEQKQMYKDIYRTSSVQLEHASEQDKHFNLHVFALISKLKQLCDHPALIKNQPDAFETMDSGKFELFKELIREAMESEQKVVVFSQYLGMLKIIRSYLDSVGIAYAGIQGSTRNRKEQIEKFAKDPNCKVFVASLQAAGVGIDLVSASVVIHYDRWWNPAKEDQATDRVHRIGQTRGVQVFKLVSKNSIEEHIDELIQKKISLIRSIVGYDEESALKKLDREELLQLLRKIHHDIEH